jgi:hypothetical protein
MHYIEVAGGNAFYEKRGRNWQPLPSERITMVALNGSTPSASSATSRTMVASAASLPGVSAQDEVTAPTQMADATPAPRPAATAAAQPQARQERVGKQARAVQVAMRQPDSARFGASDFDTAQPSSVPFMTASASSGNQPTLSFQSTPTDTDAVARLIMSENRPVQ